MKIAFGQINPTVGALEANADKIIAAYNKCVGEGAELVVFPELAITGYPPEDLLLKQDFIEAEQKLLQSIAQNVGDIPMIIGATYQRGHLYNAAHLIKNKMTEVVSTKTNLPNYGVFDEERYFERGDITKVFEIAGKKLGVIVCEDIWSALKAAEFKALNVEQLIVINASPYETGKLQTRYKLLADRAAEIGVPLVYVNQIGGQDEIIFDGGSFITDAKGNVTHTAPEFVEFIGLPQNIIQPMGDDESRYNAVSLGLRDYMAKNGFTKVVLGLSGGVDSAIVAVVAADILGKDNVRLVMMPSRYTSHESYEDAEQLAKNLGIELEYIDIEPAFKPFQKMLSEAFLKTRIDITEENMQSRIRGVALMALSNKFGGLLLTTGNKSEIAVGYSTLYGDSCGGYNVLKDLYKTEVYALCEWRNKKGEVIPKRILTKAPTAELREGQTDQDSLPPYETLDAILKHLIEGNLGVEEVITKGFAREVVEKTAKLLKNAEYKRFQSAPGAKVSSRAFTKDWRYPLTNKYFK